MIVAVLGKAGFPVPRVASAPQGLLKETDQIRQTYNKSTNEQNEQTFAKMTSASRPAL